ncbi:E3 ubiquitin-protein ligase RNF14-like [Anneissia japonica]|uniref:E3 ubiquitin-protein ligase RNF14-like n=1 Tax=Anneissia japonica TaxID=1529436 RepID=UPI0014255644|nr:E3 ubiquitin-protein ligase RNF14-like [Anneissia japonica]XP_033112079.1 E3 ubiquitin-protein ligase RNF14-like [Anneissia japonica]
MWNEEQEDELLALQSIYEDEKIFIRADDKKGGKLTLPLQLPQQPFYIKLSDKQAKQALNLGGKLKEEKDGTCLAVEHLPPLVLHFQYPKTYPSTDSPSFTLLSKWLPTSMLSCLCTQLDNIWQENQGTVIMYSWSNFLINEALSYLKITSPHELNFGFNSDKSSRSSEVNPDSPQSHAPKLEGRTLEVVDPRAVQDIASPSLLLKIIIEYDRDQSQEEFKKSYFLCSVCFAEKLGSESMKFYECNHVYCNVCLKSYFEVQIKDGNVKCLTCPNLKCDSQATPCQVHSLVGNELYAQYDRLLLESSLQSMDDIVYCPRVQCQTPVIMEKGSSLGQCPKCHLTFCFFCRMTYHGVSPCRVRKEELQKIREEYEKGDENKKIYLEHRYGKRTIQRALEELHSEEWLHSNSKLCPSCGAHIQKIDGCNKMTCMKCRTYFCWLCSQVLSSSNPYSHFNNQTIPCFNQLFQGMDTEGEEFEQLENYVFEE